MRNPYEVLLLPVSKSLLLPVWNPYRDPHCSLLEIPIGINPHFSLFGIPTGIPITPCLESLGALVVRISMRLCEAS